MGILDRWTKKGKQKQLEAIEKQEGKFVESEKEKAQKTADKPAPKMQPKEKEVAVKEKVSKPKQKRKEKKAKKKDEKKVKTFKKTKKGSAYRVLIKPLVSEKAATAESRSVFTFIVDKNATKGEIKKAVKQVYGIEPIKVRVMNVQGKTVRFGRHFGKRSDFKKAIVSLPKGQSISIHEGV